jgi:hypothetical protein
MYLPVIRGTNFSNLGFERIIIIMIANVHILFDDGELRLVTITGPMAYINRVRKDEDCIFQAYTRCSADDSRGVGMLPPEPDGSIMVYKEYD